MASHGTYIFENAMYAFNAVWCKTLGMNGLGRVLLNSVLACMPTGLGVKRLSG